MRQVEKDNNIDSQIFALFTLKKSFQVKGKRQGIKAVMSNRLYKDHTKGRNMTQSLAEFGKAVSNLYNITKVLGKKHQ